MTSAMSDPPDRGRSPVRGLQRERTVLAWNRTGIAIVVVGLLLGRFAAANPFSIRSIPSVVGVSVGVWVLWVTSARPGGLDADGDPRLRQKRTAAVAAVSLGLGAAALVLAVLSAVA